MKLFIRVVAVNLTLLALVLVLVELLAGSWFGEQALGDIDIPAYREQSMDVSELYAGGGVVRWRRDRHGLRGRYPAPEKIDILAVGGSTTAESLINDGATWTDTLARSLSTPDRPVHVANAGLDGHSTFGHLKAFREWFPRIPGLKPRYVLFYVGINDTQISDENPSYFDSFRPRSRVESLRNRLYNDSALYHLYRNARGLYRAYVSDVVHQPGELKFKDMGNDSLVPVAPDVIQRVVVERNEGALRRYRERLRRLAADAGELGAKVIIVNQLWRGVFGRSGDMFVRRRQARDADMLYVGYLRSRIYAAATMAACRKVQDATCIDLAEQLPLEPGDLYDHVHVAPSGAAKIGEFLAREIRRHKIDVYVNVN